MKSFETQFGKTKKKLETSKSEISKLLEKEQSFDPGDKVRLTRVLQLVERYQPKRNIQEKKLDRWRNYLETMFRFLPMFKRADEKKEDISASLLSEQTIGLLRTLRHLDFNLKDEPGFSDNKILTQERPSKIKAEEMLDTSITLEYEKKHWGIERVCLDGIQNHLPSDSKGERVWIQCLVNNKWILLDEAKEQSQKIKAVRFVDDGVGFDVKNLTLLYSAKAEEKESRGQFGEGIKLVAAACLREGLDVEMESLNWRAKPVAKEVELEDTRHKGRKKVKQLAFKVQHFDGRPMIGSRTTFWKPTKAFVDELMQIDKKVLALKKNYKPAFVGKSGEIVDTEVGKIFVKGIYITKQDTLFSYNLEDVETNRDRNAIASSNLAGRFKNIIEELSDKRLIKILFRKSIESGITAISKPNDVPYYGFDVENPTLWAESFYEEFGEDAVLDSGFELPEAFKDKKINRVKLPEGLARTLHQRAGVKLDKEAVPEIYELIPTSLTLEYGKDLWGEERMLLDAVQNHLPRDSGGSFVGLRFKPKTKNEWYTFNNLPSFQNSEIEVLEIFDDGRGYDHRLLGFFHSTKEADRTSGKFGEGLKMLSAAALRKNIAVELHSRNWTAKPRAMVREIEGKKINQLVFDVTHSLKKDKQNGSLTRFLNPSNELINEFRTIHQKVLAIGGGERALSLAINGEILSLDGGLVYVKDLLIPGDHNLLFTYHLYKIEIKDRDRTFVSRDELAREIAQIIAETKSQEVIRNFFFKANLCAKEGGEEKLEFTINFSPEDAELWKKTFYEIFGEDASIRDVRSEDFDAMQQNLHVGLKLFSFPSSVYQILKRAGIATYEDVVEEMTDVEEIPFEELIPQERRVLQILPLVDEYLPGNIPAEIFVYKPKRPGQRIAAGFAVWGRIGLLKGTLRDLGIALDTYIHEKTHINTRGAADASLNFRKYLTFAAMKMALEQLKKSRPDLAEEKI